jgi:hypothetical protein
LAKEYYQIIPLCVNLDFQNRDELLANCVVAGAHLARHGLHACCFIRNFAFLLLHRQRVRAVIRDCLYRATMLLEQVADFIRTTVIIKRKLKRMGSEIGLEIHQGRGHTDTLEARNGPIS